MRRKKVNLFLIEDMIQDLQKVEELIAAHREHGTESMGSEWEYRKQRVFDDLLNHIQNNIWPTGLPERLSFIHQLMKRFYPEALRGNDFDFEKEPLKKFFSMEHLAQAA